MGRVKDAMMEDEEIEGIKEEKIQSVHLMLNHIIKLIESKNFKSDLDKEYLDLRNRIVHSIPNINNYTNKNPTTFDLKSTIKLSYGTKKILDNLNKLNLSYEELILHLIQENNKLKLENKYILNNLNKSKELINLNINSYQRMTKIFDFLDMKVRYSYNKFSPVDDSYEYHIKLEKVTRDGKEISLNKVYQITYMLFSESSSINLKEATIIGESIIYFMILYNLLKENFKVKGTIVNNMVSRLEYWEYTLNKLNLGTNIKNNDINEKIESFKLQLKQLKINRIKNE